MAMISSRISTRSALLMWPRMRRQLSPPLVTRPVPRISRKGAYAELRVLGVVLHIRGHDALHRARVGDHHAVPGKDLHAHGLGRGRRGPAREQVPRARVVAHRLEQRHGVADERQVAGRHRRAAKHERLPVPRARSTPARRARAARARSARSAPRARRALRWPPRGHRRTPPRRDGARHAPTRGAECRRGKASHQGYVDETAEMSNYREGVVDDPWILSAVSGKRQNEKRRVVRRRCRRSIRRCRRLRPSLFTRPSLTARFARARATLASASSSSSASPSASAAASSSSSRADQSRGARPPRRRPRSSGGGKAAEPPKASVSARGNRSTRPPSPACSSAAAEHALRRSPRSHPKRASRWSRWFEARVEAVRVAARRERLPNANGPLSSCAASSASSRASAASSTAGATSSVAALAERLRAPRSGDGFRASSAVSASARAAESDASASSSRETRAKEARTRSPNASRRRATRATRWWRGANGRRVSRS